jgi:hypothetical protein
MALGRPGLMSAAMAVGEQAAQGVGTIECPTAGGSLGHKVGGHRPAVFFRGRSDSAGAGGVDRQCSCRVFGVRSSRVVVGREAGAGGAGFMLVQAEGDA